ncbi:MAG: hypothetical protein KJZ90_03460 [Rhodocyclaceae bacterium]|nr:hypothetical protein [Rhodocyclaceae bacterium]
MAADWKKVAADRLREIKRLEAEALRFRDDLRAELERELKVAFHTYCIASIREGERGAVIASQIADSVSRRICDLGK